MDIYLVPDGGDRYRLVAPQLELPSEAPVATDESAARKLARLAVASYARATRKRYERERALRLAGDSEELRVLYPVGLSADEARRAFDAIVAKAVEKHRKWLWLDALALPIAVPLGLVPGPNVLLGYLAFRAVSHYRLGRAGRRAKALPVELVPVDEGRIGAALEGAGGL